MLLAAMVAFTSCEDDNDSNPTLVQPAEGSFVLNTPAVGDAFVDLEKSEVVNLTWSQPVFTTDNAPVVAHYQIQISTSGNFTTAYDANAEDNSNADYIALDETYTSCSADVSTENIDKAIEQLNGWTDPESVPDILTLKIRVNAYVQNASQEHLASVASNVVNIAALPYYIELKNADPEIWYLIGGDIADGKWGDAVPTSSLPMQPQKDYEFDAKTGQGEITWTGYLGGNGFKLKKSTSSWDDQWGETDGAYVHNDGGSGNITVSAPGIYTVTLNTSKTSSDALSVTKYEESVTDYSEIYFTGSFNSWGKDTPMTPVHAYDGAQNHDWYVKVDLSAGAEVKFYDGTDSWTYNTGGSLINLTDGAYGYGTQNGGNIVVETAGTYVVIYNDITRYYRFILQQ